jgi:hypothetical protein
MGGARELLPVIAGSEKAAINIQRLAFGVRLVFCSLYSRESLGGRPEKVFIDARSYRWINPYMATSQPGPNAFLGPFSISFGNKLPK